ncbi:MAG: MFS transporter [Myxococcales bacterium]|nr:MFS transporter [Myxococcales bacterium]
MVPEPTPARRLLALAALVVAGEVVFGLPFHVARFFRPTVLAALGIGNAELGGLFAAYGALAMLSYFPGGLLADRWPARTLMTLALVLTAVGGVVLASLPDLRVFLVVHAGFGVTTILLFWAALIRATREWGGRAGQGRAFGALEAGRGLTAALLASLALLPFHAAFADPSVATQAERLEALRRVYLVYTAATFLAALLVRLCVPAEPSPAAANAQASTSRADAAASAAALTPSQLATPTIWLHALLVLTAYCAYKGLDNYALLVMAVERADELAGARVGVLSAWLRPFAALLAGLLADRLSPSRVTAACFAALVLGDLALACVEPGRGVLLWAGVAVTCAAAFGLRGVYFAVLEETRVPPAATGIAVGVVSAVGFAPDVFFAPLTGWLLDRSPGVAGHRHVFLVLAAAAAVGLAVSLRLRKAPQFRPVDAGEPRC